MFILDFTGAWWEILIDCALLAAGLLASGHVLMWKRDPRAAIGWFFIVLWLPGVGPLAYLFFGINRIKTRARKLRKQWPMLAEVSEAPDGVPQSLVEIATVADKVTRRPLLAGNDVQVLCNGEEAYPRMLAAIGAAQESVRLCSYIFDGSGPGKDFIEALAAAKERGATVQVIIDGIGQFYSQPRAVKVLARFGIEAELFLAPRFPVPRVSINLRNHRKILTVDGQVAFTGGMNLGKRHMVEAPKNNHRATDVHFEVRGPVVHQIEEAFLEDWAFCRGEEFEPSPHSEPDAAGNCYCRAISDGPNEDFEKLQWILLGAINSAESSIKIMTPYFVPDRELIAALSAADLRGVDVKIILPAENNLAFVDWACRAMLWQVLERGVEVYDQPPPFAHTKMVIVDGRYSVIGSANLDARSLRLNFEFNLEVYGTDLAERLTEYFEEARAKSQQVTLEDVDSRSVPVRLRDGFARLFAPYL